MGLTENTGKKIYVGVKEGKIVRKVSDDPVEYRQYNSLDGVLRNMWVKYDGKYGAELHVTVRDAEQDYCLQMKLDSGYARSFMKIAPNFDLALPMIIQPSVKNKGDGKVDYGLFVRQGGKTLKWYYTRDTPNGLPDLVACKVKDKQGVLKDGWNNTAQLEFLAAAIAEQNKLLAPDHLVHSQESQAAAQGTSANNTNAGSADDLPF